jgi:NTE family protein
MTTRALVLGGGGIAGIAWETGVLAGLAEQGVDVTGADLVIGTSAGSAVAAQVTSGAPLEGLLARQVDPAAQYPELTPTMDVQWMLGEYGRIFQTATDADDMRRRLGAVALAAQTVPEAARRDVIVGRLPVPDWPDRDLRIVAVDTGNGEPVVFDRTSGVDLADAVAASCAVPGIWPAVTIGGRRYMDGGMRSGENADYATGFDRVLVLVVQEFELPPEWGVHLAAQIERLTAAGSVVEVVRADEASVAAFTDNLLDPATRTPSGLAGVAQGRAEAARVARLWS